MAVKRCIQLISSCENLSIFLAHFSLVGSSNINFHFQLLDLKVCPASMADLGKAIFVGEALLKINIFPVRRYPRSFVCIFKFHLSKKSTRLPSTHLFIFFPNSQSQVLEVAAPELLEVMDSMGFTFRCF